MYGAPRGLERRFLRRRIRPSSDGGGRRRKPRPIETERARRPGADAEPASRLGACPGRSSQLCPDTKAPASRPPRAISPRRSGTQVLLRELGSQTMVGRRAERTQDYGSVGAATPPTRSFAAAREAAATNDTRRLRPRPARRGHGRDRAADAPHQKRRVACEARPAARRTRAARRRRQAHVRDERDAAVRRPGLVRRAGARGGDAGCSVAVPGDVLKNPRRPSTVSRTPLRTVFRRRTSWRRARRVRGRWQGPTADGRRPDWRRLFAEGRPAPRDARDRSAGDGKSVAEVEAAFRKAYGGFQKWDPLMDMNVKLYSSDLREYMSTYFKNEQPYFLWLWTDAFGRSFASVAFAQGTTAGAVVEVFSDAFDEAPK